MLILLAHNTTGTKEDGTSDYNVEARVNDRVIAKLRVKAKRTLEEALEGTGIFAENLPLPDRVGRMTDPEFNSDLTMKTIEYDPHTGIPNSQRAINQAQIEGLEVVYPKGNELQIDIDNEHSYKLLQNQLLIVNKFVGSYFYKETPSKSGDPDKKHITLAFDDRGFSDLERIGLQAMLGSDRVRELLSLVQAESGDPHPTLFLEKSSAPKQLTEGTLDQREGHDMGQADLDRMNGDV
jgi:hypothetical protein